MCRALICSIGVLKSKGQIMSATISDKAKSHLESRREAAIATAQTGWRELAMKIVGGGELSGKEIDRLEELASTLRIDDPFEQLQSDVDLIVKVRERQKRLGNAQQKADELLADSEAAATELRRLQEQVMPELRARQVNGFAHGNALVMELCEMERDIKARPDLFGESTPARK